MTGGPSQRPGKATRRHLNQQTTNVSSERLMARRKLAQWWAYCVCFFRSLSLFYLFLLMLNSNFLSFQVSTKEVIKFQMVSWASFTFSVVWMGLCMQMSLMLFHNSLSLMNELLGRRHKTQTPLHRRTPTSLELTWMDLRRKTRKAKARKPKPPNEQQTL